MVSVLTRLLIYLAVVLAIPHVRRRPAAPGQLRLPGGYAIPALAAVVCVGLMLQVASATFARTAVYLAVGSALFGLARWGGANRSRAP
jgi:hypothetical protein